jgi:hypothetical protein
MPMLRPVVFAAAFAFSMCNRTEEKSDERTVARASPKPAAPAADAGSQMPSVDGGASTLDASAVVDAGAAVADAGMQANGAVDAGSTKPAKKTGKKSK